MKKLLIVFMIVVLMGAYQFPRPRLVQLTEQSANDITAKKILNIIPGDTVRFGMPFESQRYSTETFTSVANIVYVKNTGQVVSNCHIETYTGPIGEKDWIKISDRNQPCDPDEEWFWTMTNAIYCDSIYFKIFVDAGECDVYKNMVLSKTAASIQ